MMLSFEEYEELGFCRESYLVNTYEQFNTYIFEAEERLKSETRGRIDEEKVSKSVKLCLGKLVNLYAKADASMNDNVSSYSNDGVSKSFVTLSREDYEKAINATIRTYLANEVDSEGTPLLYLGVR